MVLGDLVHELQQVFVVIVMLVIVLMIVQWIHAAVIARKDPERSNRMINVSIAGGAGAVLMLIFGSLLGLIPS